MTISIRKAIFVPLLSAAGILWFFVALGDDISFGLLTTEDRTKGESPICEVHKIKMTTKRVPMWYGLQAEPPAEYFEAKEHSFPNGLDYVPGGCVISKTAFHKRHALVFSCPQCEVNRAEWLSKHTTRTTRQ